jgi:hypothetical protein
VSRIAFSDLANADLVVDAVYEGLKGTSNVGGEPLHPLLGVGNMGGFRKKLGASGRLVGVVLTSTRSEPDWQDDLDPFSGTYTYYDDNRRPGKSLHDTKVGGNRTLATIFELAHSGQQSRQQSPLVLIFESTGQGRDMQFRGLAVPGSPQLGPGEDLVAIWRSANGQRFQNYKVVFSILDQDSVILNRSCRRLH